MQIQRLFLCRCKSLALIVNPFNVVVVRATINSAEVEHTGGIGFCYAAIKPKLKAAASVSWCCSAGDSEVAKVIADGGFRLGSGDADTIFNLVFPGAGVCG